MKQLLDAGADVNAVTSTGISPLSVLLRTSHSHDTMRLLLKLIECKADPNIGTNPLFCFRFNGHSYYKDAFGGRSRCTQIKQRWRITTLLLP